MTRGENVSIDAASIAKKCDEQGGDDHIEFGDYACGHCIQEALDELSAERDALARMLAQTRDLLREAMSHPCGYGEYTGCAVCCVEGPAHLPGCDAEAVMALSEPEAVKRVRLLEEVARAARDYCASTPAPSVKRRWLKETLRTLDETEATQ